MTRETHLRRPPHRSAHARASRAPHVALAPPLVIAGHLRDVQGVLTTSVGTPVAVLCVDAAGRYCRKYVVPAQWDPSAPKSLLGCQMSNQCPADHPAIRAAARSARRAPGSAPARTAPLGSKSPSPGLQAPERACCARCALIVASMLQLCLVVAIFGLPRVSPGAANLLRLASLDCSASGSSAISADSSPDASALAGRQLSLPKANPPDPFGAGAPSLAQLDYAGVGLLTAGRDAGGAAHLLSGLQLDGQLDMEDLLLGILIACCVLAFISLLGLVVACSQPRSCTRTAATTLYYVTTLPVWVALGFAVAFCFVFRAEAESLVRRYWLCAPSDKHRLSAHAARRLPLNVQCSTLVAHRLTSHGARTSRRRRSDSMGRRRCRLQEHHSRRLAPALRQRSPARGPVLCQSCGRRWDRRRVASQCDQLRPATCRRRPLRCGCRPTCSQRGRRRRLARRHDSSCPRWWRGRS